MGVLLIFLAARYHGCLVNLTFGHTDMQGSLSHNMALSAGRANAVVDTLVNEHGISSARLEGRGIGPLAPVASNTQEVGRGKNRRVVLVQR